MRYVACAALLAFAVAVAGCSSTTVLPAVTLPDFTFVISLCEEAVSPTEGYSASSASSQEAPSTDNLASGPAASSPSVSSGGGSSAGGGSAPSHSHSWTAVTEQRWVVDQAAWDEPVYEAVTVCKDCGQIRPSLEHRREHALNGGTGGYGTERVQTGTVHHDEVGHYESVTVGYSCSCGATK